MSIAFPLLQEAEAFREVGAAGQPIFRQDCARYAMFYSPGCLCVVDLSDARWFEDMLASPDPVPDFRSKFDSSQTIKHSQGIYWGRELQRRAKLARKKANSWQEEPFSPECLTLYMNTECNLRCIYCYAVPGPGPAARLESEAIAAAAAVVAENCHRKGIPFYIVFHGGGEPTLHRGRVDKAMAQIETVASAYGVRLFRYVATNGVLSEAKARWLAHRFDLVGLSCDGPANIQNRQRPRWGGGDTSPIVERTARILHEAGCRFQVRTTITSAILDRQAEIAAYICQQLLPEEIHFEPVYIGGRINTENELLTDQAGEFITNFLEARAVAREYGVVLMNSGSRLGSIHGPYCHVFRHVINLVPGGVATGCFKATNTVQAEKKGVVVGSLNRETGRFEINHFRVKALCQQLDITPPECATCFNRYHCVRGCPDVCPLDDRLSRRNTSLRPNFRCRVQKTLTYTFLREIADDLWSTSLTGGKGEHRGGVYGTTIL